MTEKLKQFLKKHEDILVIMKCGCCLHGHRCLSHTCCGWASSGWRRQLHPEDGYKIAIIHHKNGSTSGLRMEPEK
jgi:hypothetical protein